MHLPLQTPLLHLCTVACGRIAPCGKKCGPEQSYRGARGASPPRLVTTLMPDGGRAFSTSGVGRSLGRAVWVSIAVCSSQYPSSCREYADRRVRVRGCGAWPWGGAEVVGQPGTRKRSTCFSHTLITHRSQNRQLPATAHRLPALVGTLSSAKSEELRARAITNLPKSSEYRRAGTGMWERVGRPVPVF